MTAPPLLLGELKKRPLVCDGAMGTRLYDAIGLDRAGICLEWLNVEKPDVVLTTHQSYVEAGADILQTNTYNATRLHLGEFGRAGSVAEVNRRAVELARQATLGVKRPIWVAGTVGPLGATRYAHDVFRPEQIQRVYAEQAAALAEAGVDLFIVETMDDFRELSAAIKALRGFKLPLIAQVVSLDGETIGGSVDLAAVVQRVEALGADVIGANCRVGPAQMLDVMRKLAPQTDLPLIAQPNAGNIVIDDYGRLHLAGSPGGFARFAREALELGISIIGGCCYSTHEHVAAIRQAVDAGAAPVATKRQFYVHAPHKDERPVRRTPSKLETKLAAGKFITCVEIDPPTDEECRKDPAIMTLKIDGARYLDRRCGVDVITVADHTLGKPWLDAFPFAEKLRPHLTEADILLHYSCRNKADTDITGGFAGFRLYGYKNILIITGDRPPDPNVKTLWAYSSVSLMQRVREEHANWFFLSASFDHTRGIERGGTVGIESEVKRLQRKIDAGARLALTQPIFDDRIELLRDHTVALGIPILPGIMPIMSVAHARNLNENFGGMHIPESVIDDLDFAGEDRAKRARVATDIAVRTARAAVKLGFPGIYLMTTFNRYDIIKDIIAAVRD